MVERADDEIALLASWEDVYHRGLLTFWLLFVLVDRPAYAYEMSDALEALSQGTMTANEQSIYRACTRFEGLGFVTSTAHPSTIGPPRKYYHVTPKGRRLLVRFAQRNLAIFHQPHIVTRLDALFASVRVEEQ